MRYRYTNLKCRHCYLARLSMRMSGVVKYSVLFGLILSCALVRSEFFTSVAGLEELLNTEEILLADVNDYVVQTSQESLVLKNTLLKIEREHDTANQDTEDYLTNPINVFRLVKRLYNDWWKLSEYARNTSDFVNVISNRYQELAFPSFEDFEESALALLRLQNTYDLNVTHVASGILNGIKYGTDLSWTDCLLMAQQALNVGAFEQTKLWLEEFYKRFNADKQLNLPVEEHIFDNLLRIGDVEMTVKIFASITKYDYNSFEMLTKAYENPYLLSEAFKEEESYHATPEFKLYERVCREEVSRLPSEERNLRCRYHSGECAFCRIAPFKLEEINLDPIVSIFHDMISDEHIELIKNISRPYMQRSLVRDDYGGTSTRENYRVSKNAWLPYDAHPITLKLLRDLDHATGLDMRESEEMQVANYGFGGHYEPHLDFYLTVIDEIQNNRLSTSMFYFSNVEQGGATAFPYLKIAVKPSKGDVVFWYNLHRSLDGDYRTKHAGCPVLKGSKWIGNVWTPDRNQAKRRPCLLHRDNEGSLNINVPS